MMMKGNVFPKINSIEERDETFSCSIVPLSFSRTNDKATVITAVTINITAIKPGMRNFVVFNSGLNQNCGSSEIGE